MREALLLIAHGSREDEANADLHHVAGELRRRGGYAVVEASFLSPMFFNSQCQERRNGSRF